jgi:5-methylcytosine-specific restriction endonuclease McrA
MVESVVVLAVGFSSRILRLGVLTIKSISRATRIRINQLKRDNNNMVKPNNFPKGKALAELKLRRAKEIKAELIEKLGGKCMKCGGEEALEFDHLFQRTWICRSINIYRRYLRYKKEAAEGSLQLLCSTCNKQKGEPPPRPLADNEPW